MATRLLERDDELRLLNVAFDRAAGGAGSVVLVSGEAGIGKASLVRAFTRSLRTGQVLAGACDDLLTPRALGPLRDAVRHVRGPLAAALAADDLGEVFPAVLEELADPHGRPSWPSRTCTGPTAPPSTCCGTSAGGSTTCPRCCS